MMMPGCAPSTPDFHESLALTKRPPFSSKESSPMYQTLPSSSCAYQSKVRSTGAPCSETVSRTTVAAMPRITLGSLVTASTSLGGVVPRTPAYVYVLPRLERPIGIVDRLDEVPRIDRP